jgi:antitoxin ParD1/3/4
MSIMPTRNVDLTDHHSHFVESLIASGRFKNASEVVRAGLRLLEQEAKENEEKLSALRSLASEANASLARGKRTTLEGEQQLADFIGRLGQRAAKRARSSSGSK